MAKATTTNVKNKKVWLDAREAAIYLNLKEQCLADWRHCQTEGSPPYYKFGRLVRYEQSELDEWIASNHVSH